MTQIEMTPDERLAMEALDAARLVVGKGFRAEFTTQNKATGGRFDPVTQIDQATEEAMRSILRLGTHGIRGEEAEDEPGTTNQHWLIDPIDGTRAFMTGMPTFMTLLGLVGPQGPSLGYADQPILGERFAGNNQDAWLISAHGKKSINTRRHVSLDQAIAATTSPDIFETDAERSALSRLKQATLLMRYGGDAYSYCMLAMGQLDLVVETGLQPYDIWPLKPIIEGAGGVVLNWQGGQDFTGQVVAAGTQALAEEVLTRL